MKKFVSIILLLYINLLAADKSINYGDFNWYYNFKKLECTIMPFNIRVYIKKLLESDKMLLVDKYENSGGIVYVFIAEGSNGTTNEVYLFNNKHICEFVAENVLERI